MRRTNRTKKLEMKLVDYLKKRKRWSTSSNFVEAFDEIKSRNQVRRILRRCKDVVELEYPRYKCRYVYGLLEWPKPTKASLDTHV